MSLRETRAIFRTWLATGDIEGAANHQARLLRDLLMILAITGFLYLCILAIWPLYRHALPALLVVLGALGGLHRLNQRGATRLAARLLVGLVAGVLVLGSLLTGTGLSPATVLGGFVLIVLAGLLFDWKAGLGALILAVISGTGLAYLEQAGVLVPPVPILSPLERWLYFAPSLVLSVGIVIAAGGSLRAILGQMQASSIALREANRRYETQAAELAVYQQELTLLLEDRTAALDDVTAQALIFMALADNSPISIMITDLEQRVTYANTAFHQTFGYDARFQDVIGQPVAAFWPEDAADQRAAIERQVAEGGWTGDVPMRRKDGSLFDVGASVFPISDTTGQVCGQAMLLRDITYRKQAERELREALAQEQRLSELRSSFVSMVSHEFRTPLSIIQSSADTLERYHDRMDADRRAQRFARIHSQVKHMAVMLDEIMTIGKLESRLIEFHPVPVDVVQLCQDLVDGVRIADGMNAAHTPSGDDEARFRGNPSPIELILESADCPPVELDEKLMRQIVTNLLSNAIKYSPQGLPVRMRLDCDNPAVMVLSVSDQGIGIPAADQPHLFEAFHRASNVGVIPGTGLGLAIVRRAVELHGGTIDLTSAEGQGTTFTITIPRQPGAPQQA